MKLHLVFVFVIMAFCLSSCTRPIRNKDSKNIEENPLPVKYENELFSINMPNGWEYNDSCWNGLDAMRNEVDLYSKNSPIWIHVVKSFLPIQWKNINEATDAALTFRMNSGGNIELIFRRDSVEVGGYPASILVFANYVDNDTIIQKQFVTYIPESHIVTYFNVNSLPEYLDEVESVGNKIISSVKLKNVKNPLVDKEKVKEVTKSSIEDGTISDEVIDKGNKILQK